MQLAEARVVEPSKKRVLITLTVIDLASFFKPADPPNHRVALTHLINLVAVLGMLPGQVNGAHPANSLY